MKKLLILILALLLCLSGAALADVYPGDTVTVNLSVVSNPDNAAIATVKFSFDSSVLEYQSASASYGMKPGSASGAFTLSNLDGIPAGTFGSITFKVKADAKPGTYPVSVYATEALTNDYQSVSLNVSGGNVVVVAAPCNHVGNDPVQENVVPATCGDDGSYDEVVYCSKCEEEMSRTAKPLSATGEHTYGEWSQTKAPTVDEEGEETRICSGCGNEDTRPVDKLPDDPKPDDPKPDDPKPDDPKPDDPKPDDPKPDDPKPDDPKPDDPKPDDPKPDDPKPNDPKPEQPSEPSNPNTPVTTPSGTVIPATGDNSSNMAFVVLAAAIAGLAILAISRKANA